MAPVHGFIYNGIFFLFVVGLGERLRGWLLCSESIWSEIRPDQIAGYHVDETLWPLHSGAIVKVRLGLNVFDPVRLKDLMQGIVYFWGQANLCKDFLGVLALYLPLDHSVALGELILKFWQLSWAVMMSLDLESYFLTVELVPSLFSVELLLNLLRSCLQWLFFKFFEQLLSLFGQSVINLDILLLAILDSLLLLHGHQQLNLVYAQVLHGFLGKLLDFLINGDDLVILLIHLLHIQIVLRIGRGKVVMLVFRLYFWRGVLTQLLEEFNVGLRHLLKLASGCWLDQLLIAILDL